MVVDSSSDGTGVGLSSPEIAFAVEAGEGEELLLLILVGKVVGACSCGLIVGIDEDIVDGLREGLVVKEGE